jgi:hypothetical protein
MPESIQDQIEKRIASQKRGRVFFPSHFESVGSDEAVRQSLARLEKKGVLLRLAHGIYLYPKKDKIVGIVLPSIDELAEAIAKRDKARIVPTGTLALNKLGLSTQVPLKTVYLTDGAPRSIKIGKRVLKFKRTVPRNLAVKGEVSGLVIQALRELGEGNATSEQLQKIKRQLEQEKPEILKHDAALAPAWIREIMLGAISKSDNR